MSKFLFVLTLAMLSGCAHLTNMHTFTKNDFLLSGAEYWPWTGDGSTFDYPDDVLWGFNGDENDAGRATPASPAVQACARKAWDKLVVFLENPPADILKLKSLGATHRFYLWTNDYTRANETLAPRANRLWHWNKGPKNYAAGYYKWESSLNQKGECLIPQDEHVLAQLKTIRETVETKGLTPPPTPTPVPSVTPSPAQK